MSKKPRGKLFAKLAEGTRGEVGRAGEVALEALDNPAIILELLDFLKSDDAAVVAHAAHAVMQIGKVRCDLFESHADRLIELLRNRSAWEIGEQLPKVLSEINLTTEQIAHLVPVLVRQIDDRSAIASVCALTALVRLSERQLFSASEVEKLVAKAALSPRKAVAARARRLMT
ncbi:MAG: hypothetical protein AB3N20_01590 [Rhizobiaceae bacterium]